MYVIALLHWSASGVRFVLEKTHQLCDLHSERRQTLDELVALLSDVNQQNAEMPLNQTSPDASGCDSFVYNPNIVSALYILIFPLSLLLNGAAAWVSLHLKSNSTFLVYLKNLVAADIVMTLTIPFTVVSDLLDGSNTFPLISCYISPIFYSTQYTCIALLGLISVDRFFKIMTPHSKLFGQNLTFSKVLSGSVWAILFGSTALPNMILTNQVANVTAINSCIQLKGPAGLEFHQNNVIYVNVFFWLVSVVITVCYICITKKVIQSFKNSGSNNDQGKQKIKLRVFLVVIVFFVSFGPYHIVRVPYTFQQVDFSSYTSCSYLKQKFAKEISLWFATTNTCMNPLLYIFLSREFKEKLMSMVENVCIAFKGGAEKAEGDLPQSRV